MSKYTERAKKALVLARDEAKRFNHAYLGTEHLLLGVVGVDQGIAGKVLHALGVDLPRLRETLMFMIGRGDSASIDDLVPTPRAEQALTAAAQEAADLGHDYIGTEHLLLGLLCSDSTGDDRSAALRMLAGLGVDLAVVRAQVLQAVVPASRATRTRDHVVTCRVDDRVLGALDALVEAGVYTTRSEAAARLILAGLEANHALLDKVYAAVSEIRRVRADTHALTRDWADTAAVLPLVDGAGRDDAAAATEG